MPPSPRVAIVGAGAVGSALGRALCVAGYPVTMVASRSRKSAEACAAFIAGDAGGPPPATTTHPERTLAAADLVLLTVPDDALPAVAAVLAGAPEVHPGVVVAHCAGAVAAGVLAPVEAAGAAIGALHPLLAFADPATAVTQLPGTVFGLEADDVARPVLERAVHDVGGTVLAIAPGGKAAYHAAAAVISNYTTVLAGAAVELMTHAGAEPAAALSALLPLLEGTVANLRRVGLPGALTGPIARGDVETVRAHLEAIRDRAPDLLPLYAACGRQAVRLARAKGTLPEEAADVLRTVLARLEG